MSVHLYNMNGLIQGREEYHVRDELYELLPGLQMVQNEVEVKQCVHDIEDNSL